MAEINLNELTKEQIEGAMECETPEELMAFAKKEGYEISEEEAKAYLAELEEVDGEVLKQVAGGAAANANEQKCKADSPVLHGMCVTGDTMLMLADGSEKRADALTGSERLLTWDFDKGMATGRKMFFLHKGTYDEPVNVLRLRFSDGGDRRCTGRAPFL